MSGDDHPQHPGVNWKDQRVWLTLAMGGLSLLAGGLMFTHFAQFQQITQFVRAAGPLGWLVFSGAYIAANLLILPATAFNLAAGAIYGGVLGLLLSSIAGFISALIAFGLARILGQKFVERYLAATWQDLNQRLKAGGLSYAFASRLLPILPYGVVSFVAGLSQIRQRDYILGTLLGTPLGIAPVVFLGSTGVEAISNRNFLPLMITSTVLAILVGAGTWFKQH